jgi:enoyl-CoA hydratase/carnithine racemase
MCAGSQFTLRRTKAMLNVLQRRAWDGETEETLGWFAEAAMGEDLAEGRRAFIEKRPPKFPYR